MSMQNYLVVTPIRGLVRADGGKRRPIEPGQVVALPGAIAEGLEPLGAIEATDAEPTVELIFLDDERAARTLAAELREKDRDTLIAAVADIGGVLLFPDDLDQLKIGEATGVVLIAADDKAALAGALRDLGGDVMFAGEQLDRIAAKLSNAELVKELAGRVTGGVLPLHELPDSITGKRLHSEPPGEGAAEAARASSPAEPRAEAPLVEPAAPAPQAAPKKAAAKPKSAAK